MLRGINLKELTEVRSYIFTGFTLKPESKGQLDGVKVFFFSVLSEVGPEEGSREGRRGGGLQYSSWGEGVYVHIGMYCYWDENTPKWWYNR